MNNDMSSQVVYLTDGKDRFAVDRGMGISSLRYKVAFEDTQGALFIIEQTMHAKGGPPRHLHLHQDEWFYILQGEFILEVGAGRFELSTGDSLLAPRKMPHTWAYVGSGPGKLLISFTPAGKMQAFFDETAKLEGMPRQDPDLWLAHDMELLGPPLEI
jgi:mannose-6-phosphate isomerase-like protein (cupin superfamily)